jgi:hypothetical protein
MSRFLGVVLTVLVATASCKSESERTLIDTEGREVKARCHPDRGCVLTLVKGEHASDKTGLAIATPGHIVGLCDVSATGNPDSPSDCRPIVCQADSGCPPAHGLSDGTCINGLCVEPDTEQVTVEDAVMLCLSGTGLGTTKPDRLAMGLNCGSPCRIPAVCRQP